MLLTVDLGILIKYNEKLEGNLTVAKFKKMKTDDEPGVFHYINEYGSWNNAKKAAGLIRDIMIWDKEVIKEKLLQASQEVEGYLSIPKYHKWSKDKEAPSVRVFYKEFGSWTAAKNSVGLKSKTKHLYTDEDMIEAVKQANRELKNFTTDNYEEWSQDKEVPSRSAINARLGSINNILKNKIKYNQFCNDCLEKDDCEITLDECEYKEYAV